MGGSDRQLVQLWAVRSCADRRRWLDCCYNHVRRGNSNWRGNCRCRGIGRRSDLRHRDCGSCCWRHYWCGWHGRVPDGQEPERTEGGSGRGKWMVVTGEGIGQVRFYSFCSQELAWRCLNDAWTARVILGELGCVKAETSHWLALQTIRKQFGVSPCNSMNHQRVSTTVAC